MKKIRLKIILPLFFLLPLLFILILGGTPLGLLLVKESVNLFGGDVVSMGRVEGRLLSSFVVEELRIAGTGQDLVVEKIAISWSPLALATGDLHLEHIGVSDLTLTFKETAVEEEIVVAENTKQQEVELPLYLLPIKVQLDHFSGKNIQLFEDDGELLFQFDSFKVAVTGDINSLTVNEFDLQGPDVGLALHGNIHAGRDWRADFIGNWRLAGFGFHKMSGTFSVDGPLERLDVTAALVAPGDIRVQGIIDNLLEAPTWTATLKAKNVNLSTWILYCPEIELLSVTGDLYGDFGNYRGKVHADGLWGYFDGMHLTSELDGDGLGIDFKSLRIDRGDGYASADGGMISWAELFSWKADLKVENFDPSVFSEKIQGQLSASLSSVGDVREEGLEATIDIENLHGSIHEHPVSLNGALFLTENGILSKGLQLQSGDITGVAKVEDAKFMWDETSIWSGKVLLDNFDPSVVCPGFYGQVNGNVEAEGYWDSNGLFGSIALSDVSGKLRNNVLSGGGELRILEKNIESTGFFLKAGDSEFRVEGGVSTDVALKFSFSSSDLSELLPDVSGNLSISGTVAGSADQPKLNAKIDGGGLQYAGNRIGKLGGEIAANLLTDGVLTGKLSLEDALFAEFPVQSAYFILDGTTSQHRLNARITGEKVDAGFVADGSYSGEWQGNIQGLFVDTVDFGEWKQKNEAELHLKKESISVVDFCVGGDLGKGCMETQVDWGKGLEWSVSTDVEKISLGLLSGLPSMPVTLSGDIKVKAHASGGADQVITANATIGLPAAELYLADTHVEEVLQFEDSFLDLDLSAQVLQLNGALRQDNGGQLVYDLQVVNFGGFSTPLSLMNLEGDVQLDRFHVTMFGALDYYGIQPTGWVSSSLTLGGTIVEPELFGSIELREGGVELIYEGITLNDVKLSVEASPAGAKLRGQAVSGEGYLNADGIIGYDDSGISGLLHLTGEQFHLVNLPEYSFEVSPDVNFKFNALKGEIEGSVTVSQGLIAPEELSGSVGVSDDVVLVGGDGEDEKRGWPFYLDLEVLLGDDVDINGYGLSGRLGGNLNVKITPDDFITGHGELDLLEGKFNLYGRPFDIERGRMLFTGGPIDNPGVDVRAQKKVSDEQARGLGYTVGVDISGLVQDLQFHLFSDPYMDDTEILSHMVLGHSFAGSSEQEGNLLQKAASTLGLAGGVAILGKLGDLWLIDDLHLEGSAKEENVALVVGKRITEDLYIGYDINMFSQLGQFRVRYDLTRGFWVETQSSSESTGADLLYTFER